jgi:phycoerythrin-associated linker protein
MNIQTFVEQSIGTWRSQRSAHHMAFGHFEAVRSTIAISALALDDSKVLDLCKVHGIEPSAIAYPFYMEWEGESDWDEDNPETIAGSCALVPVPDPDNAHKGRLLREQGYAETMPAIGEYHFAEDGTFVLITPYERAAAEEKIWFENPNLRFRVSLIKTSAGSGVVTASFASETRSS